MKFHPQPVLPCTLFSVASVIAMICMSSAIASWEEKDGMKIEVPKRMAKLLMRITKHKLNSINKPMRNAQSNSGHDEDILTALRRMHLNGLRIRYPIPETRNETGVLQPSNSDKGGNRRLRRGAVSHGKSKKAKICRSAKIYVNLTKYSNIVAPPGFTTVYCGKTWYPMPIGNDPVTKIVSKALLEAINNRPNFSKPVFRNSNCCVPSKEKNLVVLYNDPKRNFSMIKYIPKAIVRSCGCPLA